MHIDAAIVKHYPLRVLIPVGSKRLRSAMALHILLYAVATADTCIVDVPEHITKPCAVAYSIALKSTIDISLPFLSCIPSIIVVNNVFSSVIFIFYVNSAANIRLFTFISANLKLNKCFIQPKNYFLFIRVFQKGFTTFVVTNNF